MSVLDSNQHSIPQVVPEHHLIHQNAKDPNTPSSKDNQFKVHKMTNEEIKKVPPGELDELKSTETDPAKAIWEKNQWGESVSKFVLQKTCPVFFGIITEIERTEYTHLELEGFLFKPTFSKITRKKAFAKGGGAGGTPAYLNEIRIETVDVINEFLKLPDNSGKWRALGQWQVVGTGDDAKIMVGIFK
jgi:hypothetical protein